MTAARRRRRAPWWAGPSRLFDTVIGVLRVPAVIASALVLGPLLVAGVHLARRVLDTPALPVVFAATTLACVAIGVRLGRHRRGFGHLGTLEHELAHAAVALVTFHPVTGGSVRRDRGHVTYSSVSGGNWLIGIAPYILPVVPVAAVVAVTAARLDATLAGTALVGTATGWHLLATASETRGHQPDLQRLGRLTWVPVVVAANVAEVLLLIGWVLAGPDGAAVVLTDTVTVTSDLIGRLRGYLS